MSCRVGGFDTSVPIPESRFHCDQFANKKALATPQ
jgi:hypothetical protein